MKSPNSANPIRNSFRTRSAINTGIRLKAQCLKCHGPKEQILPEVRDALARDYPKDQATGFQEGDLRGWFWLSVPENAQVPSATEPEASGESVDVDTADET